MNVKQYIILAGLILFVIVTLVIGAMALYSGFVTFGWWFIIAWVVSCAIGWSFCLFIIKQ